MTLASHGTSKSYSLAPVIQNPGRSPFAYEAGNEILVALGASLPFYARDVPLAPIGSGYAVALTHDMGVRERAAAVGIALERTPQTATAPGAVLADHTAAWIWCGGVPHPRLIVASERHTQTHENLVLRRITLVEGDVAYPAGVPTLAPHRAFAELTRTGADESARSFAERLVAQGWVTSSDLLRIAFRARRSGRGRGYSGPRTGRAQYKKLAALARAIESKLEAQPLETQA
ncbi:hypothetical protein M3B90_00110 [Dermabacter sp. p3-SID358]|uniref:hypothetical protein n=1 Tax=Dermabacter sp. p3-SID358 TaxID=2916114 RepID=UPI0021A2DC7A|nr:hypothetical protein [Dermabacter sp. p3-SID358]MCT1865940.1 hypothetical protein [Dermabacter sp. p3-SID358]